MTDFFEIALGISKEQAAHIDRERVLFLRDSIRAIPLPQLTNKDVSARIADKHREFQDWLEKQTKEL